MPSPLLSSSPTPTQEDRKRKEADVVVGVFCLSSRWNKWVGYHLLAEQSGSTRTDRRPLLLASLLGEKLRQGRGVEKEGDFCTGPHHRMSHRKWRETKQQPSRLSDRARSGNQLLSCLVSLHFLWDIPSGGPGVAGQWPRVMIV